MQADNTDSFSWFFACPQFIEPLLADELLALGAEQVKIGHAGVQASGDLRFGYNVMLWSRLASRATLQLAQGFGKDQTELQALLHSIPWDQHVRPDGTLKVRFFGLNDDIRNTQFGAQWVKDQIGDQFRSKHGERPSVSNSPDIVVVVNLHKGNASIGLELNQQSLHQRGYHDPDAHLPLRENLACAILTRAGWPVMLTSDAAHLSLFDPLCSSSTLLIEGALMAFDIAPGLLRGKTVADRWLGHDAALWLTLREQARQRQQTGLANANRFSFAAEGNPAALFNVRTDWQAAGLPVSCLLPASPDSAGMVITLLPYEETSTAVALRPAYQQLGQRLAALPEGFRGGIFCDAAAPFPLTELFYSKEYRFLNSEAECKLYTLDRLVQKERPAVLFADDLANRIGKNLRKLKPFIKRGHTNAYRVYDADIPEYAIAVDRYADWLHVQEYAPPKTIDEKTAQQRLEQALMTLPEALGVRPDHIVLKQRKQQKGRNQYEKQGRAEQALTVSEYGVKLKVNLTDYLDTGLFLDHRPMRYWMQQHASGKAVLNLFCYTGTVSVHAAVGGATRVDSVDMSATYLDWAEDNFALNGLRLDPYKYRFVQANALEWLERCKSRYDLIFLDPPTFSNSKRMDDVFDVQRDHVQLIRDCMRLLEKDGTLVFSNNFRKFKLDPGIERAYAVQDYRLQSLPEDFQRDPKIHGCWLIRHK
ncbi:MAG TPA: bifunctional 23S rRNA (guanine(2069)-N(7))-methyltransferase RlmK/23S rRNA (guanine(2445)-N(2))-methyltransferase RlmL [Candidatus Thiothrix moscowensis]|uniref:bifunctional 23S rRNA (guanine(2069)-N(7))-methyltransferase RlmK/23S rRNA (guanine(2445)-N(2))-methyltransferase RlmL n=1 Tax=unclassified Thiothrix TaxID=2636184 RepID=UPI0025DED266|nr:MULTISPECIES: bifunctional 23S rRNA (guanine(2069)-N(7))-methyltransferase RlmK/23S rRNA (guanine(2445)-N(2))-methyltransferase RlmL [unclassified Thiothrix]HRJ53729.1 bifunctional 23S rRNA (guanine(2069)-N(7))-methyltransferase RlmK/23S rRNA (guanine(2445)-N(2))-methyltransferase RlmL [Candidatus Thiothrix moscowensis]HRJ93811.1 bifunctional 23S rRNA (guanine(2069)-N(7))-methyltransferase RlmK/23S rRNA (guanine(2445)-N(2))-methyltransferase RlmL [Candidatus Thiothrix moscowensis]